MWHTEFFFERSGAFYCLHFKSGFSRKKMFRRTLCMASAIASLLVLPTASWASSFCADSTNTNDAGLEMSDRAMELARNANKASSQETEMAAQAIGFLANLSQPCSESHGVSNISLRGGLYQGLSGLKASGWSAALGYQYRLGDMVRWDNRVGTMVASGDKASGWVGHLDTGLLFQATSPSLFYPTLGVGGGVRLANISTQAEIDENEGLKATDDGQPGEGAEISGVALGGYARLGFVVLQTENTRFELNLEYDYAMYETPVQGFNAQVNLLF